MYKTQFGVTDLNVSWGVFTDGAFILSLFAFMWAADRESNFSWVESYFSLSLLDVVIDVCLSGQWTLYICNTAEIWNFNMLWWHFADITQMFRTVGFQHRNLHSCQKRWEEMPSWDLSILLSWGFLGEADLCFIHRFNTLGCFNSLSWQIHYFHSVRFLNLINHWKYCSVLHSRHVSSFVDNLWASILCAQLHLWQSIHTKFLKNTSGVSNYSTVK